MTPIKAPKKLIEVALPLGDINAACALEKQPFTRKHPRSIHIWWARRPLAAARAVLFAQMVNDPGYESGGGFQRGVNKKDAALERERLFVIIRKLVLWENTNNEEVLEEAREEIRKSWRETCSLNARHPQASQLFNPEKLPAFHDPFAGGGAIPLEAQRLGLESHASDLNPVAVLINKAMIEIPPKFADRKPVGPIPQEKEVTARKTKEMHEDWSGARGLAEDVRRYGHWVREQAEQRTSHLYPKVEITAAMAKHRPDLKPLIGQKLAVIAWLWARTVRSPNPVYSNVEVPLASTFLLSTKAGNEAWVEPVVSGSTYHFEVRVAAAGHGRPPASAKVGTTAGKRHAFRCLMSDVPVTYDHIRAEGKAGRMGARLMAIVVEGVRGRIYLDPSEAVEVIAKSAQPTWQPDTPLPDNPRDFKTPNYGLRTFGDLFTARQLVALTTFSDLVGEVRERIHADALQAGMIDDGRGLDVGGTGATAYVEAVGTYLAIATSRWSDLSNSLTSWNNTNQNVRALFSRQAIPMAWDFVELSPFGSVAPWTSSIDSIFNAFTNLVADERFGFVYQADAQTQTLSSCKVVSTDPPYYDNIGYADLSDFFYVWLRRSLRSIYPALFATVAVPKSEELVATPYRHGTKEGAEKFFLNGMTAAMRNVADQAHGAFPVTIYYAFKQSETKDAGTASTGWETFLAAVIRAGLALTGTWPMRTERDARSIGIGSNALASSIILVCRRRPTDAPSVSRKDFLRELKETMKEAMEAMLGGENGASSIAPVDLAQAALGPGMAVYSQYAAVLEANGEPMGVHTALTLINKEVDETLGGENFDVDTNFCLGWFQDVGWSAGDYGSANTLAQAKGTSVEGVKHAGVIESGAGKVRLFKPADYAPDWDPREDNRTPVWEALHQLVRALGEGGESAAGALLARMPERGPDIRRLATWLYTLCERKKLAEDARGYNELVAAWYAIETASQDVGEINMQGGLDV
jgi:putative DNA methylase